MQKKSNLFLYPGEYKVKIDWTDKKITAYLHPPKEFPAAADLATFLAKPQPAVMSPTWKPNEYGSFSLPPAERPARGIATQFAKLQHWQDKNFKARLASFVSRFGLLGITGLTKYSFEPPLYGKTYEENIDWWLHHAAEINRLLQLYSAIKRARKGEGAAVEDKLAGVLEFRRSCKTGQPVKKSVGRKKEVVFIEAFWTETGEEAGFAFEEEMDLTEAAAYVLVGSVSRGLAGGITLGKGELKPSKKLPIGFSIVEQRYTHYPLAAIFYDLWELIRADEAVEVCAYSKCSDLFAPQRSTGKFCSPTCRVAHGRALKKAAHKAASCQSCKTVVKQLERNSIKLG